MSQVYLTEPQTTGRVVLETSHGSIDVNLWCTECPSTTRAFLQLCIDGYFNGMLFHRILNEFLIQTGLTRSSATRPDINSITSEEEEKASMDKYMKQYIINEHRKEQRVCIPTNNMGWFHRKKLELCPRIKFNHRGQIALAIPLDSSFTGKEESDALDSEKAMSFLLVRQFFITLSEASFLNHKHVIFGTVSGPTIFNAIRIGKTEVDSEGRAVDFEHVPKIIAVKIDFHPFTDLVATVEDQVPWKRKTSQSASHLNNELDAKQRRKQRKGKKDVNVLSFGDEMQDDNMDDGHHVRVQSIHDVVTKKPKIPPSTEKKNTFNPLSSTVTLKSSDHQNRHIIESNTSTIDSITIIPCDQSLKITKQQQNETINKQNTINPQSSSIIHSNDDNDNNKYTDVVAKPSAIEARRAKYLSQRQGRLQNNSTREEATISKLQAFQNKISILKHHDTIATEEKNCKTSHSKLMKQDDSLASRIVQRLAKQEQEEDDRRMKQTTSHYTSSITAPVYAGQILEDTDDDKFMNSSSSSWMKTHFQCKRHMDTDMMITGGDGRSMDEYQVIDDKTSSNRKK